jgi:hypothetical protein
VVFLLTLLVLKTLIMRYQFWDGENKMVRNTGLPEILGGVIGEREDFSE